MFMGLFGSVRNSAEWPELIRNQQVVGSSLTAGSSFP